MNRNIYSTLTLVVALLLATNLHAQVTIGSENEPAKGALLELKTHANYADSTTTEKGGLLLPRVKLVEEYNLQPFINTTLTHADSIEHIGLTVYNVSSSNGFTPGIYYWDGSKWKKSAASEYIWMPSFTLPWGDTSTPISVDLYAIYAANLETGTHPTTGPTTGHKYLASDGSSKVQPFGATLPAPGDFVYIITDYDDTVIEDVTISAVGIFTYKPKVATVPDGAYVNIILKKK
jgi:hypothetical protein